MTPQGSSTRSPFTPLGPEALALYEKRLLEDRKRALRELGRFDESVDSSDTEADGDLTSYPLHQADQGTDTMEQEKNFLFASREGRLVWEIDEALRRLYRTPETFGRCERCGDAISAERLDALPHARTCVRCAAEAAAGAGPDAVV